MKIYFKEVTITVVDTARTYASFIEYAKQLKKESMIRFRKYRKAMLAYVSRQHTEVTEEYTKLAARLDKKLTAANLKKLYLEKSPVLIPTKEQRSVLLKSTDTIFEKK